ncbi:MAG: hypothetical protein M0Q23_07735 [Syntrophales bacterium]|jgi:8-oxo-dGTP pyrophosphatase MutT (NUDIX family)|nr:hypothetical protein [Syntrophales bacterium]MCK9528515.1 hypothetical protein [Syntrophales bacterium]MDX9922859.1 hypothetical protein [Syntrophales bacterium]
MSTLPALRNAATVILTRDRDDGSCEIFFMRRHHSQAFMSGAFVFPGGRLDGEDCHPALRRHIKGTGRENLSHRLQEPALPESIARGLHLAAIREMFEEAGVLLAADSSGSILDFRDVECNRRFTAYRDALHREEITLLDIAGRENIRFLPSLLLPYAHWMTPEVEPKRFDTRFFIARLPAGQHPSHDGNELTASAWMTPAQALSDHGASRIVLMPPTLKTVEELKAFKTTDELLQAVSRHTILPILPQAFETEDGGFGVKLPFDPEYSIDAYKLPIRPSEPSRIVCRNGIWRTATA